MQDSLISVVIPAYNVSSVIERCLLSVINQTYTNIEIIIINDGSTDSTKLICDSFLPKDSRINVIHQVNKGLSEARNTGIKIANGKLITFIDSDDWIEKDMIQLLHDTMINNNADISMCGFYFDYPNNSISLNNDNTTKIYTKNQALNAIMLDTTLQSHAWGKLYQTKYFKNILFPEGRIYEDYATTYKIYAQANKLVQVNIAKYHYMQNSQGLSKSVSAKKEYHFLLAIFERYEYAIQHPEIIFNWTEFRNKKAKEIFNVTKRIVRDTQNKDASFMLSDIKNKICWFIYKNNTNGISIFNLLKLKAFCTVPKLYATFLILTKKNKKNKQLFNI